MWLGIRHSVSPADACLYVPSSPLEIEADPRPEAQVQPGITTGFALFGGQYIVVMIDTGAAPQTNTSTAQVLQWAQPGLTCTPYENRTLVSNASSRAIAPYAASCPQPGTGLHNVYSFFPQQPGNFTLLKAFVAVGGENRTKFDIGDFAEQAGLGKSLAANYFVSRRISTMTGNGTATGVDESSKSSTSSTPITGEAVGWGKNGCYSNVSCLPNRYMPYGYTEVKMHNK